MIKQRPSQRAKSKNTGKMVLTQRLLCEMFTKISLVFGGKNYLKRPEKYILIKVVLVKMPNYQKNPRFNRIMFFQVYMVTVM